MAADLPLYIKLLAKDMASKTIANVSKEVGTLGRISGHAQRGVRNLATNLARVGAVAAVGIGAAVKSGIDSLAELESAISAVDGAASQMSLAVTGTEIAKWANEIESAVGAAFDDKAITAATANLIRYGKVSESNLRPAMVVMTDLAARTGDVGSASNLLARALADPAKAAGRLSKSGVVLTKAQQDTIKAMVKANDVAGAQDYILSELAKTTGGAAAAMNGPYKDAMLTLGDVTEDAQRALAEGFLPVLVKASKLLKGALADPTVVANIRSFGQTLATGLDSLIEIARNLPWTQIGDSLRLAGAGAKAVLGAFSSLPPWVQTAVLTGWGLNKLTGGALGAIVGELGKGLIKGVLGMTAGVVNINAAKVFGGGGLPGGAAPKGGLPTGAAPAAGLGLGAAGLGTLAAGIGGVLAMNLLPYLARGREGIDKRPTLETNRNPAQATEAVWGTISQQMTATARGTEAVRDKVSNVSADIRNGFAVQASSIRNGFTTVTSGASRTTDAIRNGFAINTATLRAKNFAPKVVVPVTVTNTVSVRAVTQRQTTVRRYTGGTGTSRTIL